MARYIMKFGGSSVATVEHVRAAASVVARKQRDGHEVVVVLSAMGDTTDELLARALAVSARPPARELDMLLSSGEQVSVSLMAMALRELGLSARSWLGHQVRILTDNVHSKARIAEVETGRLEMDLAAGVIPVVAGFQGIDDAGEVTTLGRGGPGRRGMPHPDRRGRRLHHRSPHGAPGAAAVAGDLRGNARAGQSRIAR